MRTIFYFLLAVQTLILNNGLYAEGEVAPPRDQGFGQTLVMIAIAIVFFYLILWRPEQKRRKAADELRNSIKKGDKVTAMGILGIVLRVQEHTVIVKMYDGSKLEFVKAAISDVVPGSEEDVKKAEKEDRNLANKSDVTDDN